MSYKQPPAGGLHVRLVHRAISGCNFGKTEEKFSLRTRESAQGPAALTFQGRPHLRSERAILAATSGISHPFSRILLLSFPFSRFARRSHRVVQQPKDVRRLIGRTHQTAIWWSWRIRAGTASCWEARGACPLTIFLVPLVLIMSLGATADLS